MSTHFLVEGADTGSYRERSSIKGGLKSLCFIPLCCLLLLTALSRGGGGSRIGPTWRMGPSALTKDAGLTGRWVRIFGSIQGKRGPHELLFEAFTGNKCSESKASVLGSTKERCWKGKWINVLPFFSFLCRSVWMWMSGLCPKWDLHCRSPSVSTWKHRGPSCTTLGEVHQR